MTQTSISQESQQTEAPTKNFAQMDEWLKTSGSKWVRLEPNQSIVLTFDENKVRIVDRDFKGDGKFVQRAEYEVLTQDGQTKTIEFAKTWAQTIQTMLKKNKRKLEISRSGVGKDTSYTIIPV